MFGEIDTSKLNAQLEKLKSVSPHAILAGAYVLLRGSKQKAPVDTGFLRESGEARETSTGAEVEFAANYAWYQEFGTSKMPAHPYVRPTIDEDEQQIVEATANEIQKEIKDKL